MILRSIHRPEASAAAYVRFGIAAAVAIALSFPQQLGFARPQPRRLTN